MEARDKQIAITEALNTKILGLTAGKTLGVLLRKWNYGVSMDH